MANRYTNLTCGQVGQLFPFLREDMDLYRTFSSSLTYLLNSTFELGLSYPTCTLTFRLFFWTTDQRNPNFNTNQNLQRTNEFHPPSSISSKYLTAEYHAVSQGYFFAKEEHDSSSFPVQPNDHGDLIKHLKRLLRRMRGKSSLENRVALCGTVFIERPGHTHRELNFAFNPVLTRGYFHELECPGCSHS